MKNNSLMYGIVATVLVITGIIIFANQKPTLAPSKNDTMEEKNEDKKEEKEDKGEAMEKDEEKDTNSKMEASDAMESNTVTVEGGKFWYKPNKITVKKGEKVTLVFKNTDGTHDWVVDEFAAKTKTINTGESDTITFTPDKVGTFEFYCSVGTHRQMGMKGDLIVE